MTNNDNPNLAENNVDVKGVLTFYIYRVFRITTTAVGCNQIQGTLKKITAAGMVQIVEKDTDTMTLHFVHVSDIISCFVRLPVAKE